MSGRFRSRGRRAPNKLNKKPSSSFGNDKPGSRRGQPTSNVLTPFSTVYEKPCCVSASSSISSRTQRYALIRRCTDTLIHRRIHLSLASLPLAIEVQGQTTAHPVFDKVIFQPSSALKIVLRLPSSFSCRYRCKLRPNQAIKIAGYIDPGTIAFLSTLVANNREIDRQIIDPVGLSLRVNCDDWGSQNAIVRRVLNITAIFSWFGFFSLHLYLQERMKGA